MPLSIWFWIAMLFYILVGGYALSGAPANPRVAQGGGLLLLILIALLGWATFGGPFK